MNRPFDALSFDRSIFECNEPDYTVILGGWSGTTKSEVRWSPYDLARGSQWNSKAKGLATW